MTLPYSVNRVFLKSVLERKRVEVNSGKQKVSLEDLRALARDSSHPKDFREIFSGTFACIAEIKRASPSCGTLEEDFHPGNIALQYEAGGASAISVLTDRESFGGSIEDLSKVRDVSSLPILRKDFMIDEYQIYQARAYGADAVLLISELLEEEQLREFIGLAKELQMCSLVEGHQRSGLEKAVRAGAEIIGVNNRDLNTLALDLETCFRLKSSIPPRVIAVCESGIKTSDQLLRIKAAGYRGALMGESLMLLKDREEGLKRLLEPLWKG